MGNTENSSTAPSRERWIIEIAVVASLYYAAARLGLLLAFENTNASPVWPPSGIALAALLLRGRPVWPGIWIGAFLANAVVLFQSQAADPAIIFVVSLLIGAGNTLEALAGGYLLQRLNGGQGILERVQNVFKFAAAALFMCLVSPCIGPTALCAAGIIPWSLHAKAWFTWWLGDVGGVLVVTPLILAWSRPPRPERAGRSILEAAATLALVCALGWISFGSWPFPERTHYPLVFLTIPLLLWPAFRFGRPEAQTALFLVSGIAVWRTISGEGPFVQKSLHESLLLVAWFIAVVTTTVLAITAILNERRLAEEASLRLYADTVRNIPMGLAVLRFDDLNDPATLRLVSMNAMAGQISGLIPEEVIGKTVAQFRPAVLQTEIPGIYLSVIRSNRARDIPDFRYPGERFMKGVFHLRIFPLPDQSVGVAYEDITDNRRSEEALLEKTEELVRSNQELNQFASVASHDLHEPVRKILAFSRLLREKLGHTIDPEALDFLQRMHRSVENMETLIEDLLTLARVTSKAKPHEKVELTAVAQEALLDLEPMITQAGGRVSVGRLPRVNADPLQMRQLLQNLIANAVKFHKKDESPKVQVRGKNLNNGFCEIAVEDSGIGFEERYLDRIFKPFTRLHSRSEYDGTGIGLAICDKIVLRHGGSITAKSAPGKGSLFTVTLPTPYGADS